MNSKNSILIVDDDKNLCRSLKLVLSKKGYKADIALRGHEALRKLRNRFFNVVLLDIKLPDIEGTELISPLKGIHPQIVPIIITGYPTMGNAISSVNNGVAGYFTKPINMDKLLVMIGVELEKQSKMLEKDRLLESLQQGLTNDGGSLIRPSIEKYGLKANELPFKIRKAIGYIEKNYTNPDLYLKEIASVVNMHPKSFSFLWNKTTKIKFRDYINNLKIEKAREMLLDSTLYISQISHKVGFSPEKFCKLFRAKVKISPTEYRKSQIKSKIK